MADTAQFAQIPPERQAVIDELTARQHRQANEITAETGQRYITSRRDRMAEADGVAVRREVEFWARHGGASQ